MGASIVEKESIAKRVLTVLLSVGMLMSLLVATSAMTDIAYADDVQPGTSQEFSVTIDGVDYGTLTETDARNAGILQTGPAACLYKATTKNELSQTGYEWKVSALKDYVTIEDLIRHYTGDDELKLTDIASMKFTALEKTSSGTYEPQPYTKYTFDASTLVGQDKFFKNITNDTTDFSNLTSDGSPIALAFWWHEAASLRDMGGRADTAYLNIKNDDKGYINDVRFFMGLDEQTVALPDGDGANMGRRLPYGVTAVDITLN